MAKKSKSQGPGDRSTVKDDVLSKGPNSTNNSAEELLISYYQLANLDNYKTLFVSPVSHVTRIYVAIIFEYMKLMNQKISSKAPKGNYSFIFGLSLS